MVGTHIFAFFCGLWLALYLRGPARDYEPDEEDGFFFDDEEDTQEYEYADQT